MDSKNIKIKFERNKSDNASDSITTYSLMAVLAGSFFIQILLVDNVRNIFISSIDKGVILLLSGVALCLMLISIEKIIDVFHFTYNNKSDDEIKSKYKSQLCSYNLGVIILITTFIYSFWSYVIKNIFCYTLEYFPFCSCNGFCCKYLALITLSGVTFYFTTKKWRNDLRFIKKAEIIIEHTSKSIQDTFKDYLSDIITNLKK
jgi:hypothetical protein